MGAVTAWVLTWLLFSVILGLAHLFAGLLVWRMHVKRKSFYLIFRDGCLLFFAMPLATSAFGECVISGGAWQTLTPLQQSAGIVGLGIILIASGVIYSVIVTHDDTSPQRQHGRDPLDAHFIYHNSIFLAVGSVIYATFYTILRHPR